MKRELIKVRILRPGDLVTVHPCAGAYVDLPPGLPAGARVRVVAVGYGNADVEDDHGTRFHVYFPQIDMPKSIFWHGQWIDRMTHPEGEHAYQASVRSLPCPNPNTTSRQ